MPRSPIQLLLLDFDGVIRHFDPAVGERLESEHGLAPGSIAATAFAPALVVPLVTGKLTRAAWVERIGEALGCPAAARAWAAERGEIDWDLVGYLEELRMGGLKVAVLTNGADTFEEELADHGLDGRFDGFFNSARIGFAKPDPRAFAHVCAALEVEPASVFFTDDSPAKLAGAVEIGMNARVYEGRAALQQVLGRLLAREAEGPPSGESAPA